MKSVEQRLYHAPTAKRATGVPCVDKCISSNQLLSRRNLNSYFFFIFLFYQSKRVWCSHDFCSLASIFFKLKKLRSFESTIGCERKDVCIRPFPCPRKKALAICVQSYYSSSTCVMLLSFSRHEYVAFLKIFFWFLLLSNFLVRENPS